MDDRPLFPAFFSDAEVTEDAYKRELVRLAEGRRYLKAYEFDPSLPLESGYKIYAKNAIMAAFGKHAPSLVESANAIGVPLDTLKGWMAPKGSKKHRAVHTKQFAMIVAAGVAYAQLEDTPEARTKVACRMLYARTPSERKRDAREREDSTRCGKVKAIALRAAALDPKSLEVMLDLSERLFATSTPAGGFDQWGGEGVEGLFPNRGERRPEIEDDERAWIGREEYFALVRDAVGDADAGLIDDLWDAQPDESPLNPMR